MDVHWPYMAPKRSSPSTEVRRRSRRLELRMTPEERELVDRAVEASGVGLTDFVVDTVVIAAQQILADRTRFVLHEDALAAWEELNARPAREVPGLRRLMERPSPFSD